MTPRFSLYLDLVRFLAAFLVLLSHMAYRRFTDGNYAFLREWNLGSDAVVLFFVLSGLVIAYTTDTKDRTLGAFAFNRLTRVYSVAIPAVLLTIGLDSWGASVAPAAYDGWWYNDAGVGMTLLRGLTFSTDWGLVSFRLGTNGPFWSLSYEIAYYALFAAAFYLRGPLRVVALLVMVPIFGIKPLLLMPAWLLGVLVYRMLRDGVDFSPLRAWFLTLAPPAIYIGCLAIGLPKFLLGLTVGVVGQKYVNVLMNFSNEFVWNNFIALLAAAHFLGMAALARRRAGHPGARTAMAIRWLAGGSFSLYLVHYPVLQFSEAVMPNDWPQMVRHPLLLAIALGACFLVAELFERRLSAFRAIVRHAAFWRRPAQAH